MATRGQSMKIIEIPRKTSVAFNMWMLYGIFDHEFRVIVRIYKRDPF